MRANCFLENVKHSTLLPLGSALEMLQESLLAPQVTLVLFSHVMAEHNVKFDKGSIFFCRLWLFILRLLLECLRLLSEGISLEKLANFSYMVPVPNSQ